MAEDKLVWLIGALVCIVIVIGTIIPATITAASGGYNLYQSVTGELFAGTAATAYTASNYPIVSVTTFGLATPVAATNTTQKNVSGAGGVMYVALGNQAHSGSAWDAFNVSLNYTLSATTDNLTWIQGNGCTNGNQTLTSNNATFTGLNSSCLNNPMAFSFKGNGTTDNITKIEVDYYNYTASSAYTLNAGSGQVTPTATGEYYISYTYGTGTNISTVTLVLVILPLLIAVVLLMLFLKSSGMF
jgi:hypothetical protein